VVASVLEHLAELSGERAFAGAARILLGPGRPPLDDDAALVNMRRALDAGDARSAWDAAGSAASALRGEHSVESAQRRLYRKFLTKFGVIKSNDTPPRRSPC
jgi:hypothetical protein